MSEITEKTVKILPFDGEEDNWTMWSGKFLARAEEKGYASILEGDERAPDDSESLDENIPDEAKKIKLRSLNKKAYNDLLMSQNDKTAYGIVYHAKTSDLPKGDAYFAWEELKDYYEPDTGATKVELLNDFNKMKLKDTSTDPSQWITEMLTLRTKLKNVGYQIDEDHLMINILNKLPKDYDNVVTMCEMDMESKSLTVKKIRTRLNAKFKKIKAQEEEEAEKKEEEALMSKGGFKKQFKGRCKNCGRIGHKAYQCKFVGGGRGRGQQGRGGGGRNVQGYVRSQESDKKNTTPRFDGYCLQCGKYGHKAMHCWHNPINKNKNNKKEEKANTTQEKSNNEESSDEEIGLINIEDNDDNEAGFATCRPCNDKIQKNIWIANSGASCHLTYDLEGLYDVKKCGGTIRTSNGNIIASDRMGKLDVVAIQKDGTTRKITLSDVKYSPNLGYNLFSLSRVMLHGLSFEGNDAKDIIVKTRKEKCY